MHIYTHIQTLMPNNPRKHVGFLITFFTMSLLANWVNSILGFIIKEYIFLYLLNYALVCPLCLFLKSLIFFQSYCYKIIDKLWLDLFFHHIPCFLSQIYSHTHFLSLENGSESGGWVPLLDIASCSPMLISSFLCPFIFYKYCHTRCISLENVCTMGSS